MRPGLAVLLVGADPASAVYVKNKEKKAQELGIESQVLLYPADISEKNLLAELKRLNADPKIHGILVQLPLPKHLSVRRVVAAIDPVKDVDGFHPVNVGALCLGEKSMVPCTPRGVMKMLEHYGIAVAGRDAVVVGRSNIVGKPMAQLLLHAHATVTICHSRTRDLADHVRRADLVVAAMGVPKAISGQWIKPGATVIDVGIHRTESGSLCGDVDYATAAEVAGAITPVPGGVGPMTIAMLMLATCEAAFAAAKSRSAG